MIESVNQRCCGRNINNKTRSDNNTNPTIRYKRQARLSLCHPPSTGPIVAGNCCRFAQSNSIISPFFSKITDHTKLSSSHKGKAPLSFVLSNKICLLCACLYCYVSPFYDFRVFLRDFTQNIGTRKF